MNDCGCRGCGYETSPSKVYSSRSASQSDKVSRVNLILLDSASTSLLRQELEKKFKKLGIF